MIAANAPMIAAIVSGILGLTWLATRFVQNHHRRRSLPPGPPGWPIIGNISDFPRKAKWITFAKWAQRYGDLTYVSLFGTDLIVVNSMPVLSTLFESKSINFSDRPFMYFTCELVGWQELTAFMNIGPTHTLQRKLITQAIGTKTTMTGLQGMVDHQVHLFIRGIIAEPDQVYHHVRTLAAAIVLAITYGYEVKGSQDKLVLLADKVTTELGRAFAPGAYLVDYIPILKYIPSWMPGGGFKNDAAAMKADRDTFTNDPYEFAQRQLADGAAKASFVEHHLSKQELTSCEEHQIKCTASMLYMGGADTSVSAIYTFILCMLLHPEVQKKAQAEVDSVIGTEYDHLPMALEWSRLPYVEACLKECLRWSPPSPNSLVHQVRSDEVYSGYHIPKGAFIIPNIWWFAHNPNNYGDPSTFNPERFLGETPELDPRDYVFSIGRRSCPGQLLAENTMLTVAVNILALVDVLRAKGPDGRNLPVDIEYSGEAVTVAKEFPVAIQARSEKVEALLRDALD